MLYSKYLPLQKGVALPLNKIEIQSFKDAVCQVWLKLTHWFWRRRFLNFVNLLSLFHNNLQLKKGVALHLNKLEFPASKDALCQVWLKLVLWFKSRFLRFINVFLLLHNYLPLEKGVALHLNKLEYPSPKDALCKVWVKLILE